MMMTREQRVVIGFADLARVRIQCKRQGCDGEAVFPLCSETDIPDICPVCHTKWRPPATGIMAEIEAVAAMRAAVQTPPGECIVRFEIEDTA